MFKYLANTNEVETELNARITACNKFYRALGHIRRKRYIKRSLRASLYKTIIRPIVIYGAR